MIPGAALLIRKQRAVREMQFELAEWARREERLLAKKPLDEEEKAKDDWMAFIDISFLNKEFKESLKDIIQERFSRIALIS